MRIILALFVTLSLLVTSPVFADDLILTHIGAMETKGKKFNQWWYEPQQVVLKGTGSKGANIDVTVDGKFNTIKSSVTDGTWSYNLGMLPLADHNIIIGSGTESYSFVLTIGSAPPADMSGTKGGLPEAGGALPLFGLLSASAGLIFYSFKRKND
ncbi:MAG: hypothetical protein WAV30_00245 [Microgenomates group bacterium]